MSITPQTTPNGNIPVSATSPDIQDVWVEYDDVEEVVTVTPGQVDKGTTVRFKDPKGGKLRIVFLSPSGKETDAVQDSDPCTLIIGGTYHFECFFSYADGRPDINPANGGVIDVVPQRP